MNGDLGLSEFESPFRGESSLSFEAPDSVPAWNGEHEAGAMSGDPATRSRAMRDHDKESIYALDERELSEHSGPSDYFAGHSDLDEVTGQELNWLDLERDAAAESDPLGAEQEDLGYNGDEYESKADWDEGAPAIHAAGMGGGGTSRLSTFESLLQSEAPGFAGRIFDITAFALGPELKRGDRGSSVKILQQLLIRAGARIAQDGVFNPATEGAVSAFQRRVNIRPTGVANLATKAALALFQAGSRLSGSSTAPTGPKPTNEVFELENWLDGRAAGNSFSEDAVKEAYAGGGFEDEAVDVDEEVVVGTNWHVSTQMPAAPPPCIPPTPAPASGSGSGNGRVPDDRPGAGRRTRRASQDYVRWVQSILNNVLGTRLKVDGKFGQKTARALRDFQRLAKIGVDGKLGPQTEGALRRFSRTDPPEREVALEQLAPAAKIAAGGLVLNFVKFGMDTFKTIKEGDLSFTGPSAPIGIRTDNVPPEFNLRQQTKSLLLTNFIEESKLGVEQVNIKLRCKVIYDGLNLEARFSFDPGGDRSRLLRNTVIRVDPAFDLETEGAPRGWVSCGVPDYRVLRIPVVFKIDRPWPLDNYNENFELVLSTMYGFGATASGPGRAHIQSRSVKWN
jgi:peptidoglycan hydrolase-like protein with peptidoglycan-binding domain